MIQINLLPEEFRVREKKTSKIPVVKIAVGIGIFTAVLTGIFYLDFLIGSAQLGKLEKRWNQVQPEALSLNQLRNDVEVILKPEKEFFEQYVDTSTSLTSLMMWVNQVLPEAAWLTELKLEYGEKGVEFLIKGLCLSTKDKSGIEQVETFAQALKAKMPHANLNLTTTRQELEGNQLTQFTILFNWKNQIL
ncbi:MAG: hypothetical protein HYZ83_07960 [Candidatus Omnitrophica bacterium]|nr:hypothetical protein [Candidatus Omnitrophota bacterium]